MRSFLFSIFLLLGMFSFSQGNLQFNQVLSYSQTFNTSASGSIYSFTSPLYTVPSGKVWKIEKFVMHETSSSLTSGWLVVNSGCKLFPDEVNSGPVWLKAGDEFVAKVSVSGGSNFSGDFFISIIEFNVVP
jgi:hypothetical protein